jgi:hypothetical protein
MVRLALLSALAALSCAHAQPKAKPCPEPFEAPNPKCGPCLESGRPGVMVLCCDALAAFPREPELNWLPDGCPPAFLSCFSGSDTERLQRYHRDLRRWTHNLERRCHGR